MEGAFGGALGREDWSHTFRRPSPSPRPIRGRAKPRRSRRPKRVRVLLLRRPRHRPRVRSPRRTTSRSAKERAKSEWRSHCSSIRWTTMRRRLQGKWRRSPNATRRTGVRGKDALLLHPTPETGLWGGWGCCIQIRGSLVPCGTLALGCTTAKTVKRPRQQPAHPQYANYWAPLTRKRYTMPHSAQSQHTNYWAPRTRKRHQQEHRPQRPTESSDPTQHAKGRTGDRPGPRKGATTRRNVTQGVGVLHSDTW